jgi:hypothetical protein
MSADPGQRAISIYPDQSRPLKSALPALFGGLLLVPVLRYRQSSKPALRLMALLAGFLLLLWESQFTSTISRLLFPRPVVAVTTKGIDYRPQSSWFVRMGAEIRWDEIAALYINEITAHGKKRTVSHRLLRILPKNPEMYVRQHRTLDPRRLPLLVLMSVTGSPMLIPEPAISPETLDGLLSQIRVQYQNEIALNDIEVRDMQRLSIG